MKRTLDDEFFYNILFLEKINTYDKSIQIGQVKIYSSEKCQNLIRKKGVRKICWNFGYTKIPIMVFNN